MNTPWVLCAAIGSDADGQALADHYTMQSKTRTSHLEKHETEGGKLGANIRHKHDVLIFLGGIGQRKLVTQLDKQIFTIFTSDNPVFMPAQYANAVKLRLDSNIIFINEDGPKSYNFDDIFAIKGGVPLRMEIGKWSYVSPDRTYGVHLMRSRNRWDRRTDLHGTPFLNALSKFGEYADFITDSSKNIVGSKGIFQDMLFYITECLNFTVHTVKAPWDFKFYENGSYGGGLGMLQRKEVDVYSVGLGFNLPRSLVIDYSMPTESNRMKLIARKPIDGGINIWVYVLVFGTYQWITFMALILIVGVGLSVSIRFGSDDETYRYFGIKKGSKMNYQINSVMSSISLICLYVLQMGSHTNSKKCATRLSTLTASMLTFLAFVYYTTDITAKMTSGPVEIPVKNFEDVIHYDYKVIAHSNHVESLLKNSGTGTARMKVYQDKFEMKKNREEAINEVVDDPKCLLFTHLAISLSEDPKDRTYPLKTDNLVNTFGGFGFQKNSEFVQIFNHYIVKAYEIGLLGTSIKTRGFYKTYTRHGGDIDGLKRNQNFETIVAHELNFKNVIFCFICLAVGVALSLSIATLEYMVMMIKSKKVLTQHHVRVQVWQESSINHAKPGLDGISRVGVGREVN